MMLLESNVLGAGLLAFQAFVLLALAVHFERPRHHSAFLLFWASACTGNFASWLVSRFEFARETKWDDLALDTVINFVLAFAAYALFRGEKFDWGDRHLRTGYAVVPAVALLFVVLDVVVKSEHPVWVLSYTSPNMLMSVGALLAVGAALFREPATRAMRWPVLIIFGGQRGSQWASGGTSG
jgi:hypothetical protein